MTAAETEANRSGPLWWIRTILSWTLLLATLAVLAITIAIPFAVGGERFTVLTGSMRPTYPPGTLIVVKPVDTDELRIGTAVTYQLRTGESAVVTHRIIAVSQTASGQKAFITQGDANDVPDPDPVIPAQIRGKVWYSIPYLGYVNTWLTGQYRAWIITAVATGLFGYALAMVVGSLRDGHRERRGRSAVEESDHATHH